MVSETASGVVDTIILRDDSLEKGGEAEAEDDKELLPACGLPLEDELVRCQPCVCVPTSMQNLASALRSLSRSSKTLASMAAETRSLSMFSDPS